MQGVVTDENGEPIIGANVVEKGTNNGTVTDLDGKFTMEVSENGVLQISYIGYAMTELRPSKEANLNVKLREDALQMDEVVVVGYGTVKRANLGGAVSTADAKAFDSRPIQNAAVPSFNTEIFSISEGLIILMFPSAPSIKTRGVPPLIEETSRTFMVMSEPGAPPARVIVKPGTSPCKA